MAESKLDQIRALREAMNRTRDRMKPAPKIPEPNKVVPDHKKAADEIKEAPVERVVASKEKPVSDLLNGCPVCERRRAQTLARVKKWRANNRNKG